jgi:hypothetical protein
MGRQLQQWLERELDATAYRDVSSIQPGARFAHDLERALASCSVGLVLIDPHWDPARLHGVNDWVRIELEHLLARPVPVAMVLIGGVGLPLGNTLPQSLWPLFATAGL